MRTNRRIAHRPAQPARSNANDRTDRAEQALLATIHTVGILGVLRIATKHIAANHVPPTRLKPTMDDTQRARLAMIAQATIEMILPAYVHRDTSDEAEDAEATESIIDMFLTEICRQIRDAALHNTLPTLFTRFGPDADDIPSRVVGACLHAAAVAADAFDDEQ